MLEWGTIRHYRTFRVSQFSFPCRAVIPAMALVAGDAAHSTPHHGFHVDAGIFDLVEFQGSKYLMLLRIGDVQMPVSRGYAQVVLISHLSRAAKIHKLLTKMLSEMHVE